MHSIAALKIYGKFLLGRKFLGTTGGKHFRYFTSKATVNDARYKVSRIVKLVEI